MSLLSDNDIIKKISEQEIVIEPYRQSNVTPVGYNLSFTKFIYSVNKKTFVSTYTCIEKKTIDDVDHNDEIIYCEIDSNDTLLILTEEAVWVSRNIAGTFHSKVKIVSKGLGHISTTLDPNWEGPLLISLNNPTKNKIKLPIGKKLDTGIVEFYTFVTLIFHSTETESSGKHDNKSSRIDILKEIISPLTEQKEYEELIKIIKTVSANESIPVNIGSANSTTDKTERINKFRIKYHDFFNSLNSNIDMMTKISKTINKTIEDNRKAKNFRSWLIFLNISLILVVLASHSSPQIMPVFAMLIAITIAIFGAIERHNNY